MKKNLTFLLNSKKQAEKTINAKERASNVRKKTTIRGLLQYSE